MNPDREYDEAAEAEIIEEMNEYDARTARMMEQADRLRTERKDREWEKACEAARPTPESDDEFADAVEETNAPAAKLIERLQRERDELRESILNLSHPNCVMLLRERDEARELIAVKDQSINAANQAIMLNNDLMMHVTGKLAEAREQRDRLVEMLARTRNMIRCHPEAAEVCATEALAAVKGGQP